MNGPKFELQAATLTPVRQGHSSSCTSTAQKQCELNPVSQQLGSQDTGSQFKGNYVLAWIPTTLTVPVGKGKGIDRLAMGMLTYLKDSTCHLICHRAEKS